MHSHIHSPPTATQLSGTSVIASTSACVCLRHDHVVLCIVVRLADCPLERVCYA